MKNYKLGNFIFELREEAGMDQRTLAALLGVSSSAISQCENGGGIKTEKLFQLSELFGVTLDELLSGKRAEQPIVKRLDELYYLDEDEIKEAIANGDYDEIAAFFQRIESVRVRFEDLIYKRIFAKITTDENVELEYLTRYYNQNLYNSRFFTQTIIFFEAGQRYDYIKENLLNAIGGNNRKAIEWELNKIFSLKLNPHLQEVLELLGDDERLETERNRLECFAAVFDSLPTLSKDLLYSQTVYSNDSFNMKLSLIKAMMGKDAKLLYPPMVKNIPSVDNDVVVALEGNTEHDKKLTETMAIYQNNAINGFDYNDFMRLTYDEFQKCINEDGMRELEQLMCLWQDNKIKYWNKFKTVKFYCKNSREV